MDPIPVVEAFLPEREKKYEKDDRLCVRYFRKKYKCLILWAMVAIISMQALLLIIDKVDVGKLINLLIDMTKQETQFHYNTTTLLKTVEQNQTSQEIKT